MQYVFRWNDWNAEHIARHDVSIAEAEYVVKHCRPPYPQRQSDRFLAVGKAPDGTYLQVSYIFSPVDVVYVIHARPLNDHEKKKFRRRMR
jgi:uncharacterized DUF497 family protein